MSFISILSTEFKKIRRSKMLLILIASALILWLPSILNADINFKSQAEFGITPENNFLIQGFMAFAWFIFPASMVVSTVLLSQTERSNNGILKMLALPINPAVLSMAKFVVMLVLSAVHILINVCVYYISALITSATQDYSFTVPLATVAELSGLVFLSSVPMIAFFWMISVCVKTPIFSIGIGLASIVPSVLMINTKVWYLYPIDYPYYIIVSKYGEMAENIGSQSMDLLPWIPIAVIFFAVCFAVSCLRFGQAERR